MNLRVGLIVASLASAAVAVTASACAGGAAMQAANEARYQGDRAAMLETVLDTVQSKYEVTNVNPETGLIVTRDRWYEKDGTFEDKRLASDVGIRVEDGSFLLRYEVQLLTAGPEYRVEVTPVLAQFRAGYAAPFKMKPDDLSVPGWITGKTEILAIDIYDALASYRVAAASSPPGAAVAER